MAGCSLWVGPDETNNSEIPKAHHENQPYQAKVLSVEVPIVLDVLLHLWVNDPPEPEKH